MHRVLQRRSSKKHQAQDAPKERLPPSSSPMGSTGHGQQLTRPPQVYPVRFTQQDARSAPVQSPGSTSFGDQTDRPAHMSPRRRELLRQRQAKVGGYTAMPTPPPEPNGYDALKRIPSSPAVPGYVPEELTSYGSPLTRRKALLIGIGYRNHRHLDTLPGCTNDVQQMFGLLTSDLFGFPQDSMKVLSDEIASIGEVEAEEPTRFNILRDLKWLTDEVHHGDSVVFFFAGHGDYILDKSGDETETGYDQCIMPVDFKPEPRHTNGTMTFKGVPPILDDTIYERLVRSVPSGAKVTALVDACRSGTVCDLPVTYGRDRAPRYRNGERNPPRENIQSHRSAGGCVLFSGSADHQLCLDMKLPTNGVDGEQASFGIMTKSFVDAVREMALERNPYRYAGVEPWTYGQLFDRVTQLVNKRARAALPPNMEPQEPQLSSSHRIAMWETPFTM